MIRKMAMTVLDDGLTVKMSVVGVKQSTHTHTNTPMRKPSLSWKVQHNFILLAKPGQVVLSPASIVPKTVKMESSTREILN